MFKLFNRHLDLVSLFAKNRSVLFSFTVGACPRLCLGDPMVIPGSTRTASSGRDGGRTMTKICHSVDARQAT